jgi:hypothetical protein
VTSGFGTAIDSLMKLCMPKSTGSVFATELRLFCYIFKVNMIQEKLLCYVRGCTEGTQMMLFQSFGKEVLLCPTYSHIK